MLICFYAAQVVARGKACSVELTEFAWCGGFASLNPPTIASPSSCPEIHVVEREVPSVCLANFGSRALLPCDRHPWQSGAAKWMKCLSRRGVFVNFHAFSKSDKVELTTIRCLSNHIREIRFRPLEQNIAHRQQYRRQQRTGPHGGEVGRLAIQQCPLEGVDDAGERVEGINCI